MLYLKPRKHNRYIKGLISVVQRVYNADGSRTFVKKCGDGTVPYSSLNYFSRFHNMEGFPHIEIAEIDGAPHREILSNEDCIEYILDYASGREVPQSRRTV